MKYKRLYIAYGSNINLEQMAFRCPNSKVVGTRMIPDYELKFRGVATIVPKEGAEVPVLLWEIDQRDELSLDRYEGFPRMYRKELFEVEVDGKIREGMAYLMNCGEIAPPSPTYYNGIKKGYEANGMDTSYLRAALERAVYHVQHQEQEEDTVTPVVMYDEPIPDTPDTPTGDTTSRLPGILMIAAGLVMVLIAGIGRKKKDESDDYAAFCPDFIESEE